MGIVRNLGTRIGRLLDRIDDRIDKPAAQRGTYTSGSEKMVEGEDAEQKPVVANKRGTFGRRGF